MEIRCFAKIAPFLNVVEPFTNGLWDVQSVILPVNLYDTVLIRLGRERGIAVSCDDQNVVTDERNTCYRAAELMLQRCTVFRGGVDIQISKRIPVAAGLGGGSSNATAVLVGLNILLRLNLEIFELASIALQISRDCYFFIFGLPAYIDNANFRLVPFPVLEPGMRFALVDAKVDFIPDKTRTVFGRIRKGATRDGEVGLAFLNALIEGDTSVLRARMFNFITAELMPEYDRAFQLQRRALADLGISLVFTGSGPFLVTPWPDDSPNTLVSLCSELGASVSFVTTMSTGRCLARCGEALLTPKAT